MGNEQGKLLDTTTPEGVHAMDDHLQRKFSKGIQYNSKNLRKNLYLHAQTLTLTDMYTLCTYELLAFPHTIGA